MRTITTKAKIVVAGVAGLTLGVSGVAYAYWTTTGDGVGSASTGTTTPYTITAQSTDTSNGALSPNGPIETASFKVHNGGSGVQKMSQVVVTVAESDGTVWNDVAGCSAADYKLGTSAAGASYTIANVESIAGGANSATLSVTVQMVDTGADQNGCKDASVPLYYSVS